MPRTLLNMLLMAALTLMTGAAAGRAAHAETYLFHASQSGKQTLDGGALGGNPFAAALIELLSRPKLSLAELPSGLSTLTAEKSRGFQAVDGPRSIPEAEMSLIPPPPSEKRIALVLVVTNYARSRGAPSLPGASHDALRIAGALGRAGFKVELMQDFDLATMRDKLADFGRRSIRADAAVIYSTGHGVEVDGTVYLLAGDFPVPQGRTALQSHALPLPEISQSLAASRTNLVFWGGCRDNPFAR